LVGLFVELFCIRCRRAMATPLSVDVVAPMSLAACSVVQASIVYPIGRGHSRSSEWSIVFRHFRIGIGIGIGIGISHQSSVISHQSSVISWKSQWSTQVLQCPRKRTEAEVRINLLHQIGRDCRLAQWSMFFCDSIRGPTRFGIVIH
jgi:hypothetical protein